MGTTGGMRNNQKNKTLNQTDMIAIIDIVVSHSLYHLKLHYTYAHVNLIYSPEFS